MSRHAVPARVKHQHGVLLCCPAPFHDFTPAPGPEGSAIARCTACGSTVSRAAGRWYGYGVRDALASISRAARVRQAEVEMAEIDRLRPSRARPAAADGAASGDDADERDGNDDAS